MGDTAGGPRANQRRRTRKDLLRAAARLMREGRSPTLEEVAAEALVSRATAYRYFPGTEALLLETAIDIAAPEAATVFAGDQSEDPVARLAKVDAALDEMILAHEPALRALMAHTLQRGQRGEGDAEAPARQNRRTPLIEAALAPARGRFSPAALDTLTKALAYLMGPEAMVVSKDVLELEEAEARRVKSWAAGALVAAALDDGRRA